jgi:hypothetical protein
MLPATQRFLTFEGLLNTCSLHDYTTGTLAARLQKFQEYPELRRGKERLRHLLLIGGW